MFRLLKNNKGQNIAVQYVLTFFLVVGVVVSMTVYVRRVIQGRIRDARSFMVRTVNDMVRNDPRFVYDTDSFVGKLYWEYEPYYLNSEADRFYDSQETRQNYPGSAGGVFQRDTDQTTTTRATSRQVSPREAK